MSPHPLAQVTDFLPIWKQWTSFDFPLWTETNHTVESHAEEEVRAVRIALDWKWLWMRVPPGINALNPARDVSVPGDRQSLCQRDILYWLWKTITANLQCRITESTANLPPGDESLPHRIFKPVSWIPAHLRLVLLHNETSTNYRFPLEAPDLVPCTVKQSSVCRRKWPTLLFFFIRTWLNTLQ